MVSRTLDADRITAAAGAALLHLLLLYALIVGLAVDMPAAVDRTLKAFAIVAPPPPPPPPPQPVQRPVPQREKAGRRPSGGSPPNLRSTPTEIVAPPPIVPTIVPPIFAAKIPGPGSDPSAGAADVPGPGTGSGRRGTGTGGGDGEGDGDGDGGGTPPRWLRGQLRDSDYPRGAGEAGVGGTVSVRYRVEVDGRATDCVVTGSSGSNALDDTTCRLIERRFRFAPSRDRHGRPVGSYIVENHSWLVEDEPPTHEPPRRRGRLF